MVSNLTILDIIKPLSIEHTRVWSDTDALARVNLLESVIEAVRSVRALRFGLSAGSLG